MKQQLRECVSGGAWAGARVRNRWERDLPEWRIAMVDTDGTGKGLILCLTDLRQFTDKDGERSYVEVSGANEELIVSLDTVVVLLECEGVTLARFNTQAGQHETEQWEVVLEAA
jgi:hypothetical protein